MSATTSAIIINVLLALLGLTGGIGLSHFWVLKRVNGNTLSAAEHERDIKTLFNNQNDLKKQHQQCLDLHNETLQTCRELISQNNLLIQRVLVDVKA